MDYNKTTDDWDDSHHYSPAPRHRRRIIQKIIRNLDFNSVLDSGCAQPYLLEMFDPSTKQLFGCDISETVIHKNKQRFKSANFSVVDLSKETYPENRKFDLVICSEVLEHIDGWQNAIKNLSTMSKKYLLITVPSGKVHLIDKYVGHFKHFNHSEIVRQLESNGFIAVKVRYWGFPFHSLYKYAINSINPTLIYNKFSISKYGLKEKLLASLLYYLFFFNDLFNSGAQLIILAKRKDD